MKQSLPNRPTQSPSTAPRSGFTLTELLVVIAIIAILVSLTTVGVVTVMGKARQTRIKLEVDQLDSALQAYKEKYGSYPPCDWRGLGSNTRLKQHVALLFPRYDLSQLTADLHWAIGPSNMGMGNHEWQHFRPDQALVFWLRGFSPDPQHPFVSPNGYQINNGTVTTTKVQLQPLYEFDPTRLVRVDYNGTVDPTLAIIPSYFPQGVKADASGAPYVYFDAGSYGTLHPNPPTSNRLQFNTSNIDVQIFTNAGTAIPYALDSNNNQVLDLTDGWANPESFQIIASGMDGKYGVQNDLAKAKARVYPYGQGYDLSTNRADDDNVTNFCNASRLGDNLP